MTRGVDRGDSQGKRGAGHACQQARPTAGDAVRLEGANGRGPLEKTGRVRGRYRLEDLVARMPEDSHPEVVSWGEPAGTEEW